MPDTSKVEVLFYKASSGAIFCLQGVGATLQIRFGDLLCIRLTCMAIAKLITFSVNASDSVYFSRRTDPVKRGMDDQLYHAFTFDPSKSLLQRYDFFSTSHYLSCSNHYLPASKLSFTRQQTPLYPPGKNLNRICTSNLSETVLGKSPPTIRAFLFDVHRECPIFASSKQ